ncbi:MAG: biofilm regulation diguanylate cyclase SiaD [Pseudomonadota bacterium]
MVKTAIKANADHDLLAQVEALLDDPAHKDNPLYQPLRQMLELTRSHSQRLERLVHISDRYHSLSRNEVGTLEEQYDRQLRRLEKLTRISDRYQQNMIQLNISLREAALHDPLTGMGNRRFLMDRLREEVERATRNSSTFCVTIIDIDHFKRVNDRYGHEAGDQLLCELAQQLPKTLREYDVCGRWGGEEFLLIFPDTPQEAAFAVAERVRHAISQVSLSSMGDNYPITASLGLTGYVEGESYSETVNRADHALYRAKALGRNRTEQT